MIKDIVRTLTSSVSWVSTVLPLGLKFAAAGMLIAAVLFFFDCFKTGMFFMVIGVFAPISSATLTAMCSLPTTKLPARPTEQ